jgi:hypothetical protein
VDRCHTPDIRLAFTAKLSKIHGAAVPSRRVRSVDRGTPASPRLGVSAILAAGCWQGPINQIFRLAGMAVDRDNAPALELALPSRSARTPRMETIKP